jgi:hypothetical protein
METAATALPSEFRNSNPTLPRSVFPLFPFLSSFVAGTIV